MGCVEKYGYPRCYGAFYDNAGCYCPAADTKIKTGLALRVADLETKVEALIERVEQLEKERV